MRTKPLILNAPSKSNAVVIDTPVILAPMAGVTNAAFRRLCREQGAGLYICEMITARGLAIGDQKTVEMLTFWPDEPIRSVQLYGVDPASLSYAIDVACDAFGANHIDLNFGCPVPKVTRKGGGGVLPWKTELMRQLLTSAVDTADKYGVPLTIKTRIGIDEDHETYLETGRLAQQAGVAAVCLHGRTVQQAYSGKADWEPIARLVEAIDIPVLGNGDIWEASDAIRMMEQTGCAGIEIGRGCLGRPWLFRDLTAALTNQQPQTQPKLGEVKQMMRRHAELLATLWGETHGIRDFRKHAGWYLKGFPVGGELRNNIALVESLQHLDQILTQLDDNLEYPQDAMAKPRGRQGSARGKVAMPSGWLDDRNGLEIELDDTDLNVSG